MRHAGAILALSGRDVWVMSPAGQVDHWNGRRWKFSTSIRNPPYGLAGSSPRDVWVTGYYYFSDDSPYLTLAKHWNGTSWRGAHTANPTSENDVFQAITEISPSKVWAVGYDDKGPLAEHYNGRAFRPVKTATLFPMPQPFGYAGSQLSGVAGTSSNVWAVGSYEGDGALIPLAERHPSC